MNGNTFLWCGRPVRFRPGQSIGTALLAAGVAEFGVSGLGQARYFCGVGACQGCTVRVDGIVREACIAPAVAGAVVEKIEPPEAEP